MKYLHVVAGGHGLLIEATRVAQVSEGGDGGIDLGSLFTGVAGERPGVSLACDDGRVLGVDGVRGLVELADEDLALAGWLPEGVAVDALTRAALEGGHAWRVQLDLLT